MYRQTFLKEKSGELAQVVSAREAMRRRILSRSSPFRPVGLFVRIKLFLADTIFALLERFLKTSPYVRDELWELGAIEPRTRGLLIRLLRQGIATEWRLSLLAPDAPFLNHCSALIGPVLLSSGKHWRLDGGSGGGVGLSVNDALTKTLAEVLERHSICRWNPRDIARGAWRDLRRRGAVHPATFSYFSEKQLLQDSFARFRVGETDEIGWVKAWSMTEKRSRLIPAQLAYIFYDNEHADEPIFYDTTSNGVAAAASRKDAEYRAICEAVERDAFLIFWLTSLTPSRIIPESIPSSCVQNVVREALLYGLELHILDITTDIPVPAFAAVLIDQRGGAAVSVGSVAGFDILGALEKLTLDILRFTHFAHTPEDGAARHDSLAYAKQARIETMKDRGKLWHRQDMIPHVRFLTNGEAKDFSEIAAKREVFPGGAAVGEKISRIAEIFKKKQYQWYSADVTSDEAQREGLFVVRALAPQLLPMYFIETHKCLGVRRLYDASRAMGYADRALREEDLNQLPHPFL